MSDDIDITQDLTGGASDANLADSAAQAPPGTVPSHGTDAINVNQQNAPNQQVQQPADQSVSLRDQLSAAFKSSEQKPTDQQNASTAQPPVDQQQQAAAPVALTKDAAGKYHTPDGAFASAEQIAAFEAAQQPPADQQQQSALYAGMTPAEQQQFQSLPAELRTLYERRMEDLNTRASRYGEYEQIEQNIIGPRRQFLAQHGNNPYGAINALFALSDFAMQDPGRYVLWFAAQHGLDMDALLDAQDQQQQNVDPNVRQLQGQVQQLTQQLNMQTQAQQQAAHAERVQSVVNFAEAKDASGNLLRPYVTDVLNEWNVQIQAVRAANPQMSDNDVLQKAYDNAVWANPTVRAKMQEVVAAQQSAQQQQQVQQAKAAGASVTGAPAGSPSTQPNNSNLSLRDELQMQFDAARAV